MCWSVFTLILLIGHRLELFLSFSPVSSSCSEMYWVTLATVVVVTALEEVAEVGADVGEDVVVAVAVVVDVDVKVVVVVVVEVVVEVVVVVVVVVEAVVMFTKLLPFTVILLTLSCEEGRE